jgi:hypothetical protein
MEAMIMASDNTATDMIFKVAGEYRRILTLCDYIYLIPLPLGVSAYAKSGNADVPGFHARSIAGRSIRSRSLDLFRLCPQLERGRTGRPRDR